jgi:hypothetical protein
MGILIRPAAAPSAPGQPVVEVGTETDTVIPLTITPGSGATSHAVYASTSSGFTPGEGNLIASGLAADLTSYNITGRTPETTYYIRVRATNGAGSTDSEQVTAVTEAADGPGYTWLQNLPAGMEERRLLTFPSGTDGAEMAGTPQTGWGYEARGATITYQVDATKPFQGVLGTGTGQWNYTVGMGAGNNDPGVIGPTGSGLSGITELYACYLVRHSPGFVEQDAGTKFSHFFQNTQNFHIDKINGNPAFGEAYDGVAGEWAPGPTGWDGGPNGPPYWRYDFPSNIRGVFNNVNRSAALVDYTGAWQMLELYLRYSTTTSSQDGIMRMWVNGTLTADWDEINFPANAIDLPIDSAGTYGGGSLTVASPQWFRIGAKALYVPS